MNVNFRLDTVTYTTDANAIETLAINSGIKSIILDNDISASEKTAIEKKFDRFEFVNCIIR